MRSKLKKCVKDRVSAIASKVFNLKTNLEKWVYMNPQLKNSFPDGK